MKTLTNRSENLSATQHQQILGSIIVNKVILPQTLFLFSRY